jgi:hypothetical protein
MIRGSLRTWLFAVACGLMVVGLARSDEPRSTWFTRLFMPGMKTADTKKDDTSTKPAAPAPAETISAKEEWQRRVEVCDKLRLIAAETGDDDLKRRADQLDARAWDAYVRKTGARPILGDDSATEESRSAATKEERR